MGTFLYSIEIPLNDSLLQKVEQKLKENSTNYTQYGFSEDEKKEYYKLMIYMDDINYRIKNSLSITSDDAKLVGEASNRFIELDTKQYKAVKAERKNRWDLITYVKNEPENIEKIKQLIKNGANVNMQDEEGYTPLYHAYINKNNDGYNQKYELLQWLLANGGDVNHKYEKSYQYQIKNGLSYPSEDYTLLHYVASTTNDPKLIKILIKAGANINIKAPDGLTALHYAVDDLSPLAHLRNLSKTVSEISSLLKIEQKDEDKQKDEKLPFRYPTYDAVKLLLDAGAKIDKNALYLKKTKDTKTLKLLIAKGANVNATDSTNETPIYTHITYGNFDAVKILIEAGANLNNKDKYGETPLIYCEKCGKDKKICQLIHDIMDKKK